MPADPSVQMEHIRETLQSTWLVQGHITGEEEEQGLNAAVSSELGPWLHPDLSRTVGCVGVTVHGHAMGWRR